MLVWVQDYCGDVLSRHNLKEHNKSVSKKLNGWAFGPAREIWLPKLAGWLGWAKCGCQNLKVAGNMFPAFPRFCNPAIDPIGVNAM